jgi:hypothetical protein|nr:MAG TPA: hypothetical protein [Caudoviricetes sp.]
MKISELKNLKVEEEIKRLRDMMNEINNIGK